MTQKLSLTNRLWTLRRPSPLPAHPTTIDLLAAERGIILDSTSEKLSDPFLFPEMKRAVERIKKSVRNNERIGIFGDYDADGITGTAQLVHYFRRHGAEPVVYLPDRAKEGYGMKKMSIDFLRSQGVTLLITVDTGITAHEEIQHAHTVGMEVIVTDHHRERGGRPAAFAVIHPSVPGNFPNQHLCGSGVAFMLIRALENGTVWEGIDRDLVLAAIGTIGDLVPLTGENRTLVIHGLKFIPSLPLSPLQELISSVVQLPHITSTDIAFRVVPRLNAAGRMFHPNIALEALLEGGQALEKLHELNDDRKTFVENLCAEAEGMIDASVNFLCVFSEKFTPGTVGLIAGKLTESRGKPSIVGAIDGDRCTASLRSVPGIDLVECLSNPAVQSLLTTFGGHAQAAGCSFSVVHREKVELGLNRALKDMGIDDELKPETYLDAELSSDTIKTGFVKSLQRLAPFGSQNEEPKFLLKNKILSDLRTVGSDNAHLKCRIGSLKCVGFRHGRLLSELSSSSPVDIACRFGMNTWNGREEVQVFIEDLRRS